MALRKEFKNSCLLTLPGYGLSPLGVISNCKIWHHDFTPVPNQQISILNAGNLFESNLINIVAARAYRPKLPFTTSVNRIGIRQASTQIIAFFI